MKIDDEDVKYLMNWAKDEGYESQEIPKFIAHLESNIPHFSEEQRKPIEDAIRKYRIINATIDDEGVKNLITRAKHEGYENQETPNFIEHLESITSRFPEEERKQTEDAIRKYHKIKRQELSKIGLVSEVLSQSYRTRSGFIAESGRQLSQEDFVRISFFATERHPEIVTDKEAEKKAFESFRPEK